MVAQFKQTLSPHLRGQDPRRQRLRVGPECDVISCWRGHRNAVGKCQGRSRESIKRRRTRKNGDEERRKKPAQKGRMKKTFYSFLFSLRFIFHRLLSLFTRKHKEMQKKHLSPSHHAIRRKRINRKRKEGCLSFWGGGRGGGRRKIQNESLPVLSLFK